MKKLISLILFCATILSVAAVSTISGAAEGGTGDNRVAAYVADEIAPTIDGVMDDVWKNTEVHQIKNKEAGTNYRVMWNESGLYVLVNMTANDKNWFRVHINEAGNGEQKLSTLTSGSGMTGTKYGNRIFKVDVNDEITGHWLNATNTDGLTAYPIRADWIPVDGQKDFDIASKTADDGSRTVEFYLPVFISGTFNEAGAMYFAIVLKDVKDNNGVKANDKLNANSNTWESAFYQMQRVKQDVTLVGAQQTEVVDNKCDVRFLAEVANIANYKKAGFDIDITGADNTTKTVTLDTTKVYQSLFADNETVTAAVDGNYLVALKIEDIPVDTQTNVTFTVKPFVIAEGDDTNTKVYSVMGGTFTLVNGELNTVA